MREDGVHGYALIINNIDIDRREKRSGAEHDGAKLAKSLTKLGYKLVDGDVHINCTAGRIKELVTKSLNIDHTSYDSFICCIMSHGDSGYVFGVDDRRIYLHEVERQVMECKTLIGKPKIFFVQACRGGTTPDAHKVATDDDHARTGNILLPEACDVFFGYATSPDTKACRFIDDGSWYIIELCKAFDEHPKEDLLTIVQSAHYEVAMNPSYVYTRMEDGMMKSYKQSPQMVSTLVKKVYFNPQS